jgi:cytochrome P450
VQAIYNLYFHPLSKFPGPKLWAASRLPFIYCLLTGKLVKRERQFYEKYGEVIRLAPDEVSFANEQAWNDIYSFRRGHKRAGRDKAYYIGESSAPGLNQACMIYTIRLTLPAPNDQADNLITTNDFKFHARVRTLLSNSFTNDSLHSQQPLIHHHADMLVAKLRGLATAPESLEQGALVNMTDWLNFFTMDVIGDLAFGEPFGCLQTGEYHIWVRTLFSYLKGMSLAAAPRYYPLTEFLFRKLIPKSVLEGQRRHTQYANEKINRRLDLKTDRPDFMTPFMKNNVNFEKMSRDEILSTFNFIIVGGAETTATTLTGIFNHLFRNGRVLQRLCTEIRTRFEAEKDITIDTVQELPYLEAVLNEGLRMCNPIPGGLPRVVPEGGDIYAGVYLPGGVSHLPIALAVIQVGSDKMSRRD